MTAEQLPLFPEQAHRAGDPHGDLTAESSLDKAMGRFRKYLVQNEYAENTVKSFLGDLGILKRYLKDNPPVGQISTKDLQDFMRWLQYERGKPCSPKSYARRLTTTKVFFAWLAELGVVPADPAAPLIHKPVSAPLPRILYDDQVDRVLAATREMMAGHEPDRKPDPRPHLLVTLILETGIKKQECVRIKLAHIDTSNPAGPIVHIRYDNPRMQYKERRLRLPATWSRILALYRASYEPRQLLFPCTARNLEYVLANVAKLAGLSDGLSFEMLRWTCAVRDYRARMDPDQLRRKLGLSQMSWQETEPKLVRLIAPPLGEETETTA